MKILYLDTEMGAAGDMLSAALFELLPQDQQDAWLNEMNSCGLTGVRVSHEKVQRCGITGTLMHVTIHGEEEGDEHQTEHAAHDHTAHDHARQATMANEVAGHEHAAHEHHHHASLEHIRALIGSLKLSDTVKKQAIQVYERIAAAEAKVHDRPVTEIHFHEVGMLDAVADVVNVCSLLERLAPDKIVAGTVTTGFGSVHCAHGILPVPAPATEELLKGIPVQAGDIRGELVTPTGAALLSYFVDDFGPRPAMRLERTGYGCGKKEFPKANVLRASLGESVQETGDWLKEDAKEPGEAVEASKGEKAQEVPESAKDEDIKQARHWLLSCVISDQTPEDIAFAMEQIQKAGAKVVTAGSVLVQGGGIGTKIEVLCASQERKAVVSSMKEHLGSAVLTISLAEVL